MGTGFDNNLFRNDLDIPTSNPKKATQGYPCGYFNRPEKECICSAEIFE